MRWIMSLIRRRRHLNHHAPTNRPPTKAELIEKVRRDQDETARLIEQLGAQADVETARQRYRDGD